MQIIGVPQLNGVTQLSDQLEIGAFCGNECRGSKKIEQYSGSYWLAFLTVHGNDNDIITYKVYDHATGQEWGAICQTTTTFVTNAMLGNPGNPYLFVFTSNLSITATANPTAGGTVTGSGTYDYGSTCVLTATANAGYNFVNWMENGEIVSIDATYSFTVSTNRTLVANFAIPQQNYTINVSANPPSGGTVTGGGTYQQGQTCTLTASPNSSYNFVCWMENDIQVSTDANYTFMVTADRNLVAQFQIRTYTIAATAFPAGTGIVTGSNTYSLNEPCTLTATANEGYAFVNWTENGTQVSTNATYSFTVTSDRTLVANFTDLEGGQLNGLFSVSGTVKVAFSQGNLQEGGLYDTYRFADHQWDYVGEYNTATGYWVDLFSFYSSWNNTRIRNGGNTSNIWRIMTSNEWDYLLRSRVTTSGILYAKACVNYINGVILLPDDWDESYYSLNNTNSSTASFSDNTISATQWNTLEQHGAVFLPAAGRYYRTSSSGSYVLSNVGSCGYYWCSTNAVFNFSDFSISSGSGYTYSMHSVRLVRNMYNITVNSNPEEGGTVTGAGTYRQGRTITLTATPNTGYTFANWTWNGNVMSTDPNYTITVNSNKTYEANFLFNATTYTISATANPTEGGTITGDGVYNEGATCTLTATANTGYTFTNWTKDGVVVSTDTSYTFTVTESSTFVAHFELNSYEITASASPEVGGTVTGAGTYNHGETCTLIATPNPYSTFLCWKKGGEEVSTEAAYSFTVTETSAFVAHFEMSSFNITAEANPSESGTVTGAGTYAPGETCTLTATANEGCTFVNWTRNGVVVSVDVEYSFIVTETASYVANFCLNSYAITTTASPSVGGTATGGGTYYHFETAILSAIANEGYHFVNWTKNGEVVSTEATYSFIVTEASAFVAHYAVNAYNVFAMANPSLGGTVSGAGAYGYGETVTLTATSNANYNFVNWTENGVEVSTEASYSFTVEGSRSLVANFDHDYYWAANPFAYESTMAIIGIVQINGEELFSNLFEVGAFSGNECRGREWLTDQYYADLGHYLVFLTVYGDGDSTDEITFRLYDHATGEEVDKTCVTTVTFETDAIHGSNANPFAINFIDDNVAQTTSFNSGWNWWSSYIELGDNSLEALQSGLGTSGMMVKSQNAGYTSYLAGFGWYGSLTTINNESAYLIRTSEACTGEMTGIIANPIVHPIELYSGWTWVGYPVAVSMGVGDALASITPQNNDMIKSQNDGFASYLDGFGWYGSLSILNPGMGLMFKSNNSDAVTLVYPNNGTRTGLKANQTTENNYWQPNLNAYPDNMSVMAVIELDGNELQGENYELAAFANGECRGSARLLYVEPLNRYMAFLTIAGDEADELHFGLYDTETGVVETQNFASLQYETNAVVGSFAEPYVVSFRGTMGVDEWANSLHVFPNPVEKGQAVSLSLSAEGIGEVQVEIVNALGMVVETQNSASLKGIVAPMVPGVYTLRITIKGKGTCYRKLVVE